MSEWISVEDRVPKKDGYYLVFVPFLKDYPWIGVSSFREGGFDDDDATHWIELPEAPK